MKKMDAWETMQTQQVKQASLAARNFLGQQVPSRISSVSVCFTPRYEAPGPLIVVNDLRVSSFLCYSHFNTTAGKTQCKHFEPLAKPHQKNVTCKTKHQIILAQPRPDTSRPLRKDQTVIFVNFSEGWKFLIY